VRDIDKDLAAIPRRDIDADLAALPKRDIDADLAALDDPSMPQWDLYGMSASSDDRFPAASTNVRVSPYGYEKHSIPDKVVGGIYPGLTSGLVAPWHDDLAGDPWYKAGEMIGLTLPFGLATKALKAVPWLAKLPRLVSPVVRGGLTGTVLGTAEETGEVIRGGEFDVGNVAEEAALFAAFDGVLSAAGKGISKLVANRSGKKFAREMRQAIKDGRIEPVNNQEIVRMATMVEDGSAGKLIKDGPLRAGIAKIESMGPSGKKITAYDRSAGRADVVGGQQALMQSPDVTWGEVGTMMGAAEKKPITSVLGTLDKQVETGLRLHERYGTKELIYHPWRAADNASATEMRSILDEFRGLIKDNFKLGTRGRASKRVMIYATSRQRGGMDVLAQSGVKEIPTLTKSEMTTYNHMRQHLERAYNDINRMRISAGQQPFPKQENYFTFMRTLEGETERGFDATSMSLNRFAKPSKTPFRFERGRVLDDYGPVEMDAFGVFERYMRSATKHKHVTPVIAKSRKLLDETFYNGFSLRDYNPSAWNDLNGWVNFVAGVRPWMAPRQIERAAGVLNENMAFSVLGYNIRTAVQQPSAMKNTASEIGVRWALEGINGFMDKKMRNFAFKHSNHLSGRDFDISVQDAFRVANSTKRALGKAGLKPLQWLDLQTATASWIGAYKRGRSVLKMSTKDAINFADDVVVRTQASAAPGDLAPIQRTPLGKTLSMFQTFVINEWGYMTRDLLNKKGAATTDISSFRKILTFMGGTMALNAMTESIGINSPSPAPEWEYYRRLQKTGSHVEALKGAGLETLTAVPTIGGGARYGGSVLGAGAQLFSDVGKVLGGNTSTEKAVETAGKVVGVPGTVQAKKFLRLLRENNRKK